MTGLMASDESRVTIAGRDFEVHPVAAIFPEFPPEEYANLRADIEAHGVRFPVVVCGRWLVDGRTRLRACRDLDIEPPVRELDEGTDVVEWIVSANVRRRHLSTSQRAVLAAQLADGEGVTLDDAASSLSVSRMSVARARAVREIESGRVQAALQDGTVTVGDAYRVRGVDPVRLDAAVDAVRGGEAGSLVQALDLADESSVPAGSSGGPDGGAGPLPPAGDSGPGPASPRSYGGGDEAGPARRSGVTAQPAADWEPTDELRDRASAACGGVAPVDGRRLGPPQEWRGHVLWCAPSGEAPGARLAGSARRAGARERHRPHALRSRRGVGAEAVERRPAVGRRVRRGRQWRVPLAARGRGGRPGDALGVRGRPLAVRPGVPGLRRRGLGERVLGARLGLVEASGAGSVGGGPERLEERPGSGDGPDLGRVDPIGVEVFLQVAAFLAPVEQPSAGRLHDADVPRLAFPAEADQLEPLDARQRPLVGARQACVERDCRRCEAVALRVDDGPRGRSKRRARGGALGAGRRGLGFDGGLRGRSMAPGRSAAGSVLPAAEARASRGRRAVPAPSPRAPRHRAAGAAPDVRVAPRDRQSRREPRR